jgi:DNA-directed RNA polymerase subunit RPC12/RpoP
VDTKGVEYKCPGCGTKITIKSGDNICPKCGFHIHVEKGQLK